MQTADSINDRTWLHHLRAGDYSRWLGEKIKDDGLAAEIAEIESNRALDMAESRAWIRDAITRN